MATCCAIPADCPRQRGGTRAAWFHQYGRLALVVAGGLCLLGGFLIHLLDGPFALRVALLAVSAILTSTETFPEALHVLRRFRLDVDVLMFVAAGGAAALGHYEEGAFLLFLFGLGAAGEGLALSRARQAVKALSSVAPEEATLLRDDGTEERVRVERVAVGDRVVARPFDRLPVDGEVVDGASAVNQAPITGESTPVDKAAGDAVFAGTINSEGRLVVRATKVAGESTLARVIRLVEEAQASKSPTQLFTDRIEAWYVPMVFVATGLLIVLPPVLGGGEWATWFYRSMAFLTAASPCALAIGTPAAVLCGVGRAAQVGVLIKGGAYLEALGRVETIAFDKTGTLTRGEPTVAAVEPANPGSDEAGDAVLQLAAAVEAGVRHPLAAAIVDAAKRRGLPIAPADDVRQIAGMGATATVDGDPIRVGKPQTEHDEAVEPLRRQGMTVVAVERGERLVGFIGLADRARTEAGDALAELRGQGVKRVVMLTGDHPRAAHAVAASLGIDDVRAGLLPEDKLDVIAEFAGSGPVAMVGDGVNDAPALARASVGVAMGAAAPGTADVAIETADVVLMGSDLRHLPRAVALSRAAMAIIRQNLFIALGVIAVVAPLAALGYASLAVAVLLHEGSTVVVVLNALRLLRVGRQWEAIRPVEPACERCELYPDACPNLAAA